MDVPKGTLDLLILTILRREPLHGTESLND